MIEQYIPSVVTYPRDIPNGAEKLASARILVVDDERLVRWAVGETLRSQGYEIVEDYVPDVAFPTRVGRERMRVLRRME